MPSVTSVLLFLLALQQLDVAHAQRATLQFSGPAPEAALFSKQVYDSWTGVVERNFFPNATHVAAINQTLPAGYVSTSIPGKPWQYSLWPRDTSGFLREAIAWGDLSLARQNADAIIALAVNCGGCFPEHFDGIIPSDSGTAEDGAANVVISLVALWQRLPRADPVATKIVEFMLGHSSPVYQRWLPAIQATPGLVPGTGEFGSGCGLATPVFNVVQNSAVASALRAVGVLARSLGNSSAANSLDLAAVNLRANMLRWLTNTSDGGWLWAIDTHSLAPTPAITDATVNIGFAGINWGFTLLSDGPVGEYTPLIQTSWQAGLAASQATYRRLLHRPLRHSLWEQYGIFAQFDELNQFDAQHGGLPGHGTSAYGQDYATHYMLLNDDLVGAGRAIRFLANATAHGGQTLKSTCVDYMCLV